MRFNFKRTYALSDVQFIPREDNGTGFETEMGENGKFPH